MKNESDILVDLNGRKHFELVYRFRGAQEKGPDGKVDWALYTEEIITKGELFYASPYAFNDPFELNPSSTKVAFSQAAKHAEDMGMSLGQKATFLEGFQNMSNKEWDYMSEEAQREIIVKTGIGICCFNADPENIPMWSYYAQDHKGVCFEFDPSKDPDLFSGEAAPIKMEYPKERPVFVPFQSSNTALESYQILFAKAEGWKHEEEVRSMKFGLHNCRAIKFNKMALKAIIFGCRATPESIDHYSSLLKEHGFDHVKLKRAEKDHREYKLNIVDL